MPDPAASTVPADLAEPGPLAELLAHAARGDERAWEGIVKLYARRVYAMARSRCRRDDLAEEITQSVFATIATKLGSGGYAEQGRFEAWLFRITMNRVRDEARRLSRHALPTDPEVLGSTAAAPDEPPHADEQDVQTLRLALGSLSEPDREVVELRHHGGLSFRQIADALGEPMGTVLARHHRALRKLKEILESPTSRKVAT
ncbi:MAG: sigma-70 family RNA polymerase sigma factor [Planctomycetota bacterium]|nr:sigma-70 family RNA polymerase sigma factor [Planctomycetota bacterium]